MTKQIPTAVRTALFRTTLKPSRTCTPTSTSSTQSTTTRREPARSFSSSFRKNSGSPLFALPQLSTVRETNYISRDKKIPRVEYSPALQLIKAGEVDRLPYDSTGYAPHRPAAPLHSHAQLQSNSRLQTGSALGGAGSRRGSGNGTWGTATWSTPMNVPGNTATMGQDTAGYILNLQSQIEKLKTDVDDSITGLRRALVESEMRHARTTRALSWFIGLLALSVGLVTVYGPSAGSERRDEALTGKIRDYFRGGNGKSERHGRAVREVVERFAPGEVVQSAGAGRDADVSADVSAVGLGSVEGESILDILTPRASSVPEAAAEETEKGVGEKVERTVEKVEDAIAALSAKTRSHSGGGWFWA